MSGKIERIFFALSAVSVLGFVFISGVAAAHFNTAIYRHLVTVKEETIALVKDALGKRPWYYPPLDRQPGDEIRDPAVMDDGALTLVTGVVEDRRLAVKVVDRHGDPVHRWSIDVFDLWPNFTYLPADRRPSERPGTHIHGASVMDNGDLVFNFEHIGLMRLSACGDVVWRLERPTHHSIHVAEDGTLWVSGQTFHQAPVAEIPGHAPQFVEDLVLQVSPDGDVLAEISITQLLQQNGLYGLLFMSTLEHNNLQVTGDTLHLNDVEVFPNHLPPGVYQPNDVMVSLRNINAVIVFDPKTLAIRRLFIGRFLRQHDPDFVDGDTITVYDCTAPRL